MNDFKWTRKREKAALALAEGYTQDESAIKAGVTQRTIARWLNNTDFAVEVDRLSLMVGIAQRGERLRIVRRVIREKIEEDTNIETKKDILEWLKYAQTETDGVKLDLTALAQAAGLVADSGQDRMGEEEETAKPDTVIE